MSSRVTRRQLLGMAATAAVAVIPASRVFALGPRCRPLQTTVLKARVQFVPQSFVRPLIISSGKITEITEALAEVRVRVAGREALGRGSIYLSDLWAWPDPAFTHNQRDAAPRKLCLEIAQKLAAMCGGEAAHPLELGLRLHESVCREKTPPVLARSGPCVPALSMRRSTTRSALHWGGRPSISIASRRRCQRPTGTFPVTTPAP